jgi:hypothetical protein
MKFKSLAKQNQLIENISSQHLVVGIDIAQEIHVARAVNFRGVVVGEPLSFFNNEDIYFINFVHNSPVLGFHVSVNDLRRERTPTGNTPRQLSSKSGACPTTLT